MLLVNNCRLQAQDTLISTSNIFDPEINEPVQPLKNFLLVKEDKTGKLLIDDILKNPANDTAFKKVTNLSNTDPFSVWWCKINIVSSFNSNDFLIGIPFEASSGLDNGNDVAEVWIIKNNQVIHHYHTGNLSPVSQRPVGNPINQNIFPVELKQGQPFSIYWRIQRTKYFAPPEFQFALQHKSVVFKRDGAKDWPLFYFGIMTILFVFGLVFFIITRQKTFFGLQ